MQLIIQKKHFWALMSALCLLPEVGTAQTQVYAANTYHTFSSAGTTNGAATNGTLNLYSSVGQPMALSSTVLTQTQAGVLSAVSNGLVVYDIIAPVITPPVQVPTLTQGASFSVTVTDNVNVGKVQIFYKPITAPATTFSSAILTPGTANSFSTPTQNTWYDGMGLEYYFAATDAVGNPARMPATGSYYAPLSTTSLPVPNLPFGNVQSNYRMVAFPYDMGSATNNQVTNIYQNIGLSDSTKARMYHYDPATSTYKEFVKGGFSTIDRGKGYWLLMKSQTSLAVSNVVSPPENRKNLFSLILKPGWNQIGNPYPVNISWNDVQTLNNNANIGKLNVFSDVYSVADVLPPFQGGFVMNAGTSDITITIPFQGQSQVGGRVMGTAHDISSDTWNISLHIKQGQNVNSLGGFGMHPQALLGPDRYDNYNPPPFLQTPEVNFTRKEFPKLAFSNDIVNTQGEFSWSFVPKGEMGMSSELVWDDLIEAKGEQLYLFDEQQLTIVDMLTSGTYPFIQRAESRFSIYFGKDVLSKIRTNEVGVSGPYPNPVASGHMASFHVAVPEDPAGGRVYLQVFNATGTVVGSAEKALPPGIHELKYEFGPGHNSGLYFYRLGIGTSKESKVYTGKIILQ